LPKFRGKGYGKALALAALAEYPDAKWLYVTHSENKQAIALARALGFTLEGVWLLVS
jgi:ribosomal protein S18 acetylase RimI-like enzyme